jgi:hypothetical protein
MIRPESFTVSRETFASQRKQILLSAIERLAPHVKDALTRVGLPSWHRPAVAAATDIFDETARAEVDEWNQVIDDMRDLFQHHLGEALEKTKRVAPEQLDAQANRLTQWIAAMAVNAGTEAATTSDPDTNVGLEWVSMQDPDVRHTHQDVDGQVVPTGQPFTVAGEELMYPGQPVGDPSVWINCRCVAQPTMLTELAGKTITAAADPEEVFTTATIMALPAGDDPINAVSSEEFPHVTLLFLGEASAFDPEPIKAVIAAVADAAGAPVTDAVNGTATLGDGQADVLLLDAAHLADIRGAILGDDAVRAVHDGVEQFPTWIPHLTVGWPENPRLADPAQTEIRFDRLALWYGGDKSAIYHLGGNNVAEKHPDIAEGEKPPAGTKETALPEKFKAKLLEQYAGTELATTDGRPSDAPAEMPEKEIPLAEGENLRPWHGVLAPEGAASGDSRQFAAMALTTRDLPLPLKAMFTDDEGHKGSVVVGRIDRVWREAGLIKAEGVWDISAEAERAMGMIDRKMWRGVSVDLDAAEGEMVEAAEEGGREAIEFTKGRISSATLCAIPAFAEAFVRNGSWTEFANEPLPTGNMVPIPDAPEGALVASGATLVDVSRETLPVEAFVNPQFTELTPLTITEDGRVFGHIAGWETCHIGYEVCTTAPPSMTDYAYFLTGQAFTDAGPVAVGQITLGGGHADGGFGLRAAVAHYDNTGSAVADVTCGEDEHGIWFAGVLRDDLTSKQIRELAAAGLSGDWRTVRVGGQESYEMVAALAVNVGGFPIPRPRFAVEGKRQLSLVAAGIVMRPAHLDDDAAFAAQMERYIKSKERRERVAAMRAEVRAEFVAKIKKEMLTVGGK